jgi:hypothetical protein
MCVNEGKEGGALRRPRSLSPFPLVAFATSASILLVVFFCFFFLLFFSLIYINRSLFFYSILKERDIKKKVYISTIHRLLTSSKESRKKEKDA